MENMDTDNNVYLITILAIIGDLGDAFDQQASGVWFLILGCLKMSNSFFQSHFTWLVK